MRNVHYGEYDFVVKMNPAETYTLTKKEYLYMELWNSEQAEKKSWLWIILDRMEQGQTYRFYKWYNEVFITRETKTKYKVESPKNTCLSLYAS